MLQQGLYEVLLEDIYQSGHHNSKSIFVAQGF